MELRRADLNRERREVVAGLGRDRPLHEPEVARAHHPDPVAVPRLLAEPAQRREAVVTLDERAELALGAERAAHALDHDLQPALGKQAAEQQSDELPAPVRGADEHGRLRAVPRGAGDPAVGEQRRAVIHHHAEVLLADHIDRLGAR